MADADHSIGEPAAAVPAGTPTTANGEQLALLDAVLAAIRGYAAQHLAQGHPVIPPYRGGASPGDGVMVKSPLTSKQQEVLRCIALGFATKQTAYQLQLSPKTVAAHRAHIMERLDIHDVPGLVIYALRHDFVRLDDYQDPQEEGRLVRSRPWQHS